MFEPFEMKDKFVIELKKNSICIVGFLVNITNHVNNLNSTFQRENQLTNELYICDKTFVSLEVKTAKV